MVKWEAEFNQMMNDQRNMDFDYDTMGPAQWEDPSSSFRQTTFDDEGIPLLGDYEFGSSLFPSTHTGRMNQRPEQQRKTISS